MLAALTFDPMPGLCFAVDEGVMKLGLGQQRRGALDQSEDCQQQLALDHGDHMQSIDIHSLTALCQKLADVRRWNLGLVWDAQGEHSLVLFKQDFLRQQELRHLLERRGPI